MQKRKARESTCMRTEIPCLASDPPFIPIQQPKAVNAGDAAAVRDASVTAAAAAVLGRASKDDLKVRVPLANAGAVTYLASHLTCPSTSASTEDAAA